MKFSKKYNIGTSIKKQHYSEYWLSADKNKRMAKNQLKKSNIMMENQPKNNLMQNQNTQPIQQNAIKKPIANTNAQPYTGIDKNFQFNNNMMNMYRAAVNNSSKR